LQKNHPYITHPNVSSVVRLQMSKNIPMTPTIHKKVSW
jgi:hypothetical protein